MRLANAAANGPAGAVLAGACVVIEESAHAPALLRIVRRHTPGKDGIARVTFHGKLHPIEDKVAVRRATGAFLRQAGIGEHLETQARDLSGGKFCGDGVGRGRDIRAADEDGAVFLKGKLHPFWCGESLHRDRREDRFADGGRFGQPCGEACLPFAKSTRQFGSSRGESGLEVFPGCDVRGEGGFVTGRGLVGLAHFRIGLVAVVQVGEELVILGVGDLIILVRVATGAGESEPHPDRAHRLDAIHHRGDAPLLFINPAFGVCQGLTVEGGRENLIGRRVLDEIAGKLLNRELVEGHVGIDRVDDPVTIAPRIGPMVVFFKTVAVGIAGAVEPVTPPAFSEGLTRKEIIGQPRESGFPIVRDRRPVGRELFQRWRQAGEVVKKATDQGDVIGLGRGSDAFFHETIEDKSIDGTFGHISFCQGRDNG